MRPTTPDPKNAADAARARALLATLDRLESRTVRVQLDRPKLIFRPGWLISVVDLRRRALAALLAAGLFGAAWAAAWVFGAPLWVLALLAFLAGGQLARLLITLIWLAGGDQ